MQKIPLLALFIALLAGYVGGLSSQYFEADPAVIVAAEPEPAPEVTNPFRVKTRPNNSAAELAQLREKIASLEIRLDEMAQTQKVAAVIYEDAVQTPGVDSGPRSPEISQKDALVSVGVSPDIADDILRRISQQQYRSMELRNLMRRGDTSERRQYREELRELQNNQISLRSELGDDQYDRYLVLNGQDNRVQVASVMAGSPAELNGVQANDVILYYEDKKIMNMSDVQQAALGGEIGEVANIEILRDGNRMSLTVPRGTLGVRLGATQLAPDN